VVLGQPHEQGARQQPRIPLFPLESFLENFSGLAVSAHSDSPLTERPSLTASPEKFSRKLSSGKRGIRGC
jgi:hypothetical protein